VSDFQKWFIDQFQFAGWLPLETSDLSRGSTLAWDHQQKRIDELESSLSIAEKLLSDESYQFYIEQVTKLKVNE
jgi:hypothetical protein